MNILCKPNSKSMVLTPLLTFIPNSVSENVGHDSSVLVSGAKPALAGTPGMIGYGMAKAAVHQLVKSLSCPKSGLPEGAFCAGVKNKQVNFISY